MSTNGRIAETDPEPTKQQHVHRQSRLQFDRQLTAEDDEGSVEYKWRLTNVTAMRFEHLVTQMRFRVAEGSGQCLYELGVEDDGVAKGLPDEDFDESLATVQRMADRLNLDVRVLHERVVCAEQSESGRRLRCAELVVTKRLPELQDLRIAVCGSTGSGKSTLVGVLVGGTLDNGDGSVRQGVFNHKHEFDTGRTSSVVHRVLGFDETGRITNYDSQEAAAAIATATHPAAMPGRASAQDAVSGYASLSQAENSTRTIAERSVKLVTLMDLAGDSRYSKTAIFGMTSRLPGYACVCIAGDSTSAEDDITEYVQLCTALRIPLFIVVSKVDTLNEIEVDDFLSEASLALRSHGGLKSTLVSSLDEAKRAVELVSGSVQSVVPVFLVSSVDGSGITELKMFLHHLPQCQPQCTNMPAEVLLDSSFVVQEVGPVMCGYVTKGSVAVGQLMLLGPDRRGNFHHATVHSIHVKGSHVTRVCAGSEATFAVGTIPNGVDISRKGKVLVDPEAIPNVGREFEMTVKVLTKGDSVTTNQEPIVHCRNIRQAAKIVWVSPEPLQWNEVGRMRCRFMYNPEVIDEASVVVLRWGRHAKLIGTVCTVSPVTPSISPQMRAQLAPSPPADPSPGEQSGDEKLVTPNNSSDRSLRIHPTLAADGEPLLFS